MTTVGEITVKISADLAPLRASLNAAKKEMASFDAAISKVAEKINKVFNPKGGNKPFFDGAAGAEAYSSALDRLESKFNRASAAIRSYDAEIAQANIALERGIINQDGLATAVARAKDAYQQELSAIQKANQALAERLGIQSQINNNTGISGMSDSSARAGDIEAYGRALDATRARFDPLFAAQRTYLNQLKLIKDAHQSGAITLDIYNQNIAQTKSLFAQQVQQLSAVTGAHKLNNQQLVNLQYQLNDISVMLVSGQNPFIMLMQQGMQISQLFDSGTGPKAALKAVGAGITSFLTNPLNLSVLAIASVAGAIPLIWNAVTGGEAKKAKDTIEDFSSFIEKVGKKSEESEKKIRAMLDAPKEWAELQADAVEQTIKKTDEYTEKLKEIRRIFQSFKAAQINIGFGEDTFNLISESANALDPLQQKIDEVIEKLNTGKYTAAEALAELDKIQTANVVPRSFSDLLAKLRKGLKDARDLNDTLQGISSIEFSDPVSTPEAGKRIREAFGVFEMENATESLGKSLDSKYKPPKKDKAGERAAARTAEEIKQNQQYIADLEKEVKIMQMSYGEREIAMKQFEQEKEIREQIASLGETATPKMIAALERLIPLQIKYNEAGTAMR